MLWFLGFLIFQCFLFCFVGVEFRSVGYRGFWGGGRGSTRFPMSVLLRFLVGLGFWERQRWRRMRGVWLGLAVCRLVRLREWMPLLVWGCWRKTEVAEGWERRSSVEEMRERCDCLANAVNVRLTALHLKWVMCIAHAFKLKCLPI